MTQDEPAPLWDPERDDVLVCRQVREETHDVKTFVFSAASPRRFRFAAGQFMTFEFAIGSERINRCYTIATPPTRPDRIAITVKRQPGGRVSPWLHAEMRPGARISVNGPMGSFTDPTVAGEKYLFLSGGSGITPLMSMARAIDDLGGERDLVFAHSARTPADIIFRRELELLAAHRPGFRLMLVCDTDSMAERWPGLRGFISLPMLRLIAPDLAERRVFTCGPAGYMAAVRRALAEADFDMRRYHEESFDFSTLVSTEPELTVAAAAEEAAEGFRITFAQSGRDVSCGAGTTILEAARTAGLRLPSSCTRGLCGTCKSRLVSGTVDMRHGGGIRPREIEQGLILICCSRPTSDVVIDR